MINHVRTLLLNSKPKSSRRPGEEYVPPDFKPLTVQPAIAKVRLVLFGANATRDEINYRLWQLMVLLHITELEQFVLALDPRITYTIAAAPEFKNVMHIATLPEVVSELDNVLAPVDCKAVFGRADIEPYLTFRNLWKDHDQLAYRLGGLLLAVAYSMNSDGAE